MSGGGDSGRIRILVCEDEPALRTDLVAVLSEAGYAVSAAADGLAARAHIETRSPDLILCDISMPKMSGLELLSHVRALRPDLAEVPILLLTALADREQIIAGKQAGADDYMVKPIDYDVMLATIAAHLRQVTRLRRSLALKAEETLRSLDYAANQNAYSALDSLSPAIALLDAAGGIVHANNAAAELLTRSGGLLHARLGSDVPATIQRVQALGNQEADVTFLRLPAQGDERDLIVLLSLLPPSAHPSAPVVVALIVDPCQRTAPADALLKSLFGLTPTEARVASLLVQGDRLEEIAQGLGVQQSTVVFHLRNIFTKTGTNRQTDLVALLLTLTVAQSV